VVHRNMTGRILLKDLDGKSYMGGGFYHHVPLPSEKMRIIDILEEFKNGKRKKIEIDEEFEFIKRADRNKHLLSLDKNQDITNVSSMLLDSESDGFFEQPRIDGVLTMFQQGTQVNQPKTPKKVKAMDVYKQLQEPEKRLVLTNIKAMYQDSIED